MMPITTQRRKTVALVPSSTTTHLVGVVVSHDNRWHVLKPGSQEVHVVCDRRIDAVIARNALDYENAARIDGDDVAPLARVPVMLPWEVTQRLATFDTALLDDDDETLERLFRNDVSLFGA
jgi:hypothetical protein